MCQSAIKTCTERTPNVCHKSTSNQQGEYKRATHRSRHAEDKKGHSTILTFGDGVETIEVASSPVFGIKSSSSSAGSKHGSSETKFLSQTY